METHAMGVNTFVLYVDHDYSYFYAVQNENNGRGIKFKLVGENGEANKDETIDAYWNFKIKVPAGGTFSLKEPILANKSLDSEGVIWYTVMYPKEVTKVIGEAEAQLTFKRGAQVMLSKPYPFAILSDISNMEGDMPPELVDVFEKEVQDALNKIEVAFDEGMQQIEELMPENIVEKLENAAGVTSDEFDTNGNNPKNTRVNIGADESRASAKNSIVIGGENNHAANVNSIIIGGKSVKTNKDNVIVGGFGKGDPSEKNITWSIDEEKGEAFFKGDVSTAEHKLSEKANMDYMKKELDSRIPFVNWQEVISKKFYHNSTDQHQTFTIEGKGMIVDAHVEPYSGVRLLHLDSIDDVKIDEKIQRSESSGYFESHFTFIPFNEKVVLSTFGEYSGTVAVVKYVLL